MSSAGKVVASARPTVNEVDMQPGVVRNEEVVRYPTDDIRLRGVGFGNVQVTEYLSRDRFRDCRGGRTFRCQLAASQL